MCTFLPGSLDCETFGSSTFGKYCFIKRKECSEITNRSLCQIGRKNRENFVNRENQNVSFDLQEIL